MTSGVFVLVSCFIAASTAFAFVVVPSLSGAVVDLRVRRGAGASLTIAVALTTASALVAVPPPGAAVVDRRAWRPLPDARQRLLGRPLLRGRDPSSSSPPLTTTTVRRTRVTEIPSPGSTRRGGESVSRRRRPSLPSRRADVRAPRGRDPPSSPSVDEEGWEENVEEEEDDDEGDDGDSRKTRTRRGRRRSTRRSTLGGDRWSTRGKWMTRARSTSTLVRVFSLLPFRARVVWD